MAKARDLAALAGLAGLAYAMRNKGESTTDTGDETNRLKNRLKGRGTPEEPRTDARSSGDEMSNIRRDVSSGDEMSKYASSYKTPEVSTSANNPIALSTTQVPPASDRRNLESSMSRGTRPVDPRSLEAGMSRGSRYKQPTLMKKGGVVDKMASGGRTVSKKELEDSGLSLRDFLNKEKGLTRKAPEGISREYKPRDASDQESKKSMSAESSASRGSRNFAGSGRGESGGASSDALSRFNAGKEGYDEAGSAMKRGGSVKKMASGGMTASSRADGCCVKGKTRGKMC